MRIEGLVLVVTNFKTYTTSISVQSHWYFMTVLELVLHKYWVVLIITKCGLDMNVELPTSVHPLQ